MDDEKRDKEQPCEAHYQLLAYGSGKVMFPIHLRMFEFSCQMKTGIRSPVSLAVFENNLCKNPRKDNRPAVKT